MPLPLLEKSAQTLEARAKESGHTVPKGAFSNAYNELTEKLMPKVWEYGFLKKYKERRGR